METLAELVEMEQFSAGTLQVREGSSPSSGRWQRLRIGKMQFTSGGFACKYHLVMTLKGGEMIYDIFHTGNPRLRMEFPNLTPKENNESI